MAKNKAKTTPKKTIKASNPLLPAMKVVKPKRTPDDKLAIIREGFMNGDFDLKSASKLINQNT